MSQSASSLTHPDAASALSWRACTACRHCMLDQRSRCHRCGSARLTPLAPVTGRGKLYSFTVVPADTGGGSEALILGLVQLCEGPMLTARLEPNPGRQPQIGDSVRITRNEPGGVVFASSASVVAVAETRAASLLEAQ